MKNNGWLGVILYVILFLVVFSLIATGFLCIKNVDSTFGIETENPLPMLIAGKGIKEVENEVEQYIFTFTNEERLKVGLKALQYDQKLSAIAKAHSIDMGTNNFFSHTNLQGQDPSDRASIVGYHTHKYLSNNRYLNGISENIFKIPYGFVSGSGYVGKYNPEKIAHEIVKGWMESPGHRSNILDSTSTNIGIGVKYAKGYYYATQNFW